MSHRVVCDSSNEPDVGAMVIPTRVRIGFTQSRANDERAGRVSCGLEPGDGMILATAGGHERTHCVERKAFVKSGWRQGSGKKSRSS
jgi:hypothetical protein